MGPCLPQLGLFPISHLPTVSSQFPLRGMGMKEYRLLRKPIVLMMSLLGKLKLIPSNFFLTLILVRFVWFFLLSSFRKSLPRQQNESLGFHGCLISPSSKHCYVIRIEHSIFAGNWRDSPRSGFVLMASCLGWYLSLRVRWWFSSVWLKIPRRRGRKLRLRPVVLSEPAAFSEWRFLHVNDEPFLNSSVMLFLSVLCWSSDLSLAVEFISSLPDFISRCRTLSILETRSSNSTEDACLVTIVIWEAGDYIAFSIELSPLALEPCSRCNFLSLTLTEESCWMRSEREWGFSCWSLLQSRALPSASSTHSIHETY